jgi:peroxiredoxin
MAVLLAAGGLFGQRQKVVPSELERPIAERIEVLRGVPDGRRGAVTSKLALDIRALPASPVKLTLAWSLANLSTEGDLGRQTLQEAAITLANVLGEQAASARDGMPEGPYLTLARMVRYEGVKVPLNDPLLRTAMARLDEEERQRQDADFTLRDIAGQSWHPRALRGKVVLIGFWGTWCPPCLRQMPDLEAIYREFRNKGLVILAISDERADTVSAFLAEHKYSFPILLDPGRQATGMMAVDGIPMSFVYDREGKLVAQAMDRRTRAQLLEMIGRAGLKPGA